MINEDLIKLILKHFENTTISGEITEEVEKIHKQIDEEIRRFYLQIVYYKAPTDDKNNFQPRKPK